MAHGEIILLKELFEQNDNVLAYHTGRVYRVTGTILVHDPVNRICQIEHQSEFLWIDISLVSSEGITIDSMVQFIGEILPASTRIFPIRESELPPNIYLKATVKRIVNGLNLRVYEQALTHRRLFIQKLLQ
jgi:hypothetical protein